MPSNIAAPEAAAPARIARCATRTPKKRLQARAAGEPIGYSGMTLHRDQGLRLNDLPFLLAGDEEIGSVPLPHFLGSREPT
jgi:hypothetical protein